MNLARRLADVAARDPDRVAVEFDGVRVTYGALAERTARFAGGLSARGVGPGDRVALHLPNGIEFVVAVWGALAAGAVPTPMNPQLRRREIAHQLEDSGARLLVTSAGDDSAREGAARTGVAVVEVGGSGGRGFDGIDGDPLLAARDDDDLALMPYTSGTTGKAKGVLLTHGNLASNVRTMNALNGLAPDDYRMLVPLPMFHITGMTVMMLAPLLAGGTIFPLRSWDPAETLRMFGRHRITATVCVPTLLIDMLRVADEVDADLSSVRFLFSGGAGLPVAVLEAFERRFGVEIQEGYGLSETSPVTHANVAAPRRKPGTVGWPIPGCEMRLVDADGADVPLGDVGELWVRGPMVMRGYHGDAAATAAVLDGDGWFRTGDLATRDAEGYVSIIDRKKDMILVGGLNVYPKEVEAVLHEHPAVRECAVTGAPDERKGETVVAWVVPADGRAPGDALADELRGYCLDELAAYKHPRVVRFLDALPRTASGKVRKFELR